MRERDEQEAVSQPQGLGSFDELYSAYFRSLYRYVARRVGPDHAEELTAEVFAQAWIRRDRFDPSLGSPSTWLFAIATNLVRRHRRTEERKLRALARWHQPAFVPSSEREVLEGVAARDVWPQVAAALLEVGPTDRDCIYLYAVAGFSYAEVATTLSLPIGTVRSRINRVRGKLRRAVQGTLDLQG